jgi:hypothetical protein
VQHLRQGVVGDDGAHLVQELAHGD